MAAPQEYSMGQNPLPMAEYPQPGANPSPGGYPLPSAGYGVPPAEYPQGGNIVQLQPRALPPSGYPPPGGYPSLNAGYGAYPLEGNFANSQPGAYPPLAGYPPTGGHPPSPMPSGYQPPPPQNPWMAVPRGIPNCPPGLEHLTMIDELLVKQKFEIPEALIGFETNKYSILNSLGQKVYDAVEENNCCTRNCCGTIRPFDMRIMDNAKNEVIHLNRPLACDGCCCPCCLQVMDVYSPPGQLVGRILQKWSLCDQRFAIENASGDVVLRIKGLVRCDCGTIKFKVLSPDGEPVGKICNQWIGLVDETYTDADNFGIRFPMDLDVRMKAVMLGVVFLMDFMFYEEFNRVTRLKLWNV